MFFVGKIQNEDLEDPEGVSAHHSALILSKSPGSTAVGWPDKLFVQLFLARMERLASKAPAS